MKGAELLVKSLKKHGVKYIVGYTGGAIMPFFDEMEKDGSFEFIMSRHEQGAAFIAQGISRASLTNDTHEIGVCVSTSGPGALNLVTGIADAHMDSVPIIALTGQVPTGVIGTDAFQESDVVGVMMPITKHTLMPTKPELVETSIKEAFHVAQNGRHGPVVVDLPKNVQLNEVSKDYSYNFEEDKIKLPGFKKTPKPDKNKIDEAVKLLNKSEKPIVFCGHGVINSGCGSSLKKFVNKYKLPTAFTLHGLSAFPVDDEMSLGMMGMHGTVEANRSIAKTDLILAFGMRFDDRVTGKLEEYAKGAKVIHVEIDPSEIDKNVATSVAINADAGEAVESFMSHPKLEIKSRKQWFDSINEWRNEVKDITQADIENGYGSEDRILMKRVVKDLSDLTEGRDIIVSDVGQHQMIAARFYNFQTENSWFNSGGAGTMGAGLPMAIGAKLVRPDEEVWSINGDGGFQMNLQELGTIMEFDININIIILNNDYLGMVRQWQTLFFDERYAGTALVNPNFQQISKGYGIPHDVITKTEDIKPAIEKARNYDGAYILEFACDKTEIVLPMIPSNATFDEMIVKKPEEK
jgi:acetolactate synthase-1/2/3 large subunit